MDIRILGLLGLTTLVLAQILSVHVGMQLYQARPLAHIHGFPLQKYCVLLMAPMWLGMAVGIPGGLGMDSVTTAPHLLFLPWQLRFILWLTAAILALVSAFRPSLRSLALGALVVGPALRGVSYEVSAFEYVLDPFLQLPSEWSGGGEAWLASIRSFGLVFWVLLVSCLETEKDGR